MASRLRSVRVRITVGAVVVTAAAAAAIGWGLVRSVEDSQLDAIRDEGEDLVDQVADRLAAGTPPKESVRPYELNTGYVRVAYEDGSSITFLAAPAGREDDASAGTVLTDGPSSTGETGDLPPSSVPDDEVQALDTATTPVTDVALEQTSRSIDTASGELTVTVATPIDQVSNSIDAVRRALLVGLPLLVALVALVAWGIVGRALRPVELIRAEAAAIGATTLHRRVPEPDTGDEVHRLSQTMNEMLERLEGAVTRQRQFVADASHELRNPVAGIRTDLEAALCEADDADWPTVAREVLEEEARLETLLDDLLILAAEDEGRNRLPTADVPLDDLVTAEGGRRAVAVSLAADGPVVVSGSGSQLRRALANLVDNAQRHARTEVRISLTRHGREAELWVDDDGPGIPAADRERVFERFTRLDNARTRNLGGSGLGLAVVRSIVTRHHGRVRIDDSPLGGTRVVVTLPTS